MRKILGIVGSPRKKGNTHVLVSSILDGAREAGWETEILFLGDLQIRECDGGHVCWEGKECSKGDDMNGIYPKIIESDAIVFGTPVYWYAPTALLKGFVARLVFFNCPENREKIRGKKAIIAIPFEEENPETASLTVDFFKRCFGYLEMKLTGCMIVPGVTNRGDILRKKEILEKAYQLGRNPML